MVFPFLLLSLLSLVILHSNSFLTSDTLIKGSSLNVDKSEDILVSPSGVFSAGFYPVGDNAYFFAVWFSQPSCSENCTMVWMADRDFPVNGEHSRLSLQKTGNLILTDADKSIVWSTNTNSLNTTKLQLQDSGNLVLKSMENVILWQSFDSPTNTLLPLQTFTRNTQLVSYRSSSNFSSGFYKLLFDDSNILSLVYDGPDVSSSYWPNPSLVSWDANRFTYNSSRIASLDSLGRFTSSDNVSVLAADYGVVTQRRLTLDPDGNLRIYSLQDGSRDWSVSWEALSRPCNVHGTCGPNSICTYDLISGRKCSCIPGHKMRSTVDWSYGCEPEFSISCGTDDTGVDFVKIPRFDFYGYDSNTYPNYTLEKCKKLCIESCNCRGIQFNYNDQQLKCFLKYFLFNGRLLLEYRGDAYIKVPKNLRHISLEEMKTGPGLVCPEAILTKPLNRVYLKSHVNEMLSSMLWFACALVGVEFVGILSAWLFFLPRFHKDSYQELHGYQEAPTSFTRFSYSELVKATRNFKEEIGRGAGGIVYKGRLSDDRMVAIKRLNMACEAEAYFLAEISTIGRLNHMNLVDIWGYCAEGKHKLLVYEYMERGSLAENLSSNSLDWKKRFEIALGTARGLAYLHEECLEWVLHCDVKPQNILLDASYHPKVSDLGLSKLLNRGDLNTTNFSRMRGTRGYMAPEWVFDLPITSKVDVYSYGIVVLEMVTGKSPTLEVPSASSNNGSKGEVWRGKLVKWIRDERKCVKGGKDTSWIEEITDPRMEGEYDKSKMEILVEVALQCVEEDNEARPNMSKVVEMLLQHENDH